MQKLISVSLLIAALAQPLGARKHSTEPQLPVPPACPAKFDDSLDKNGIAENGEKGVFPAVPKFTPEAEFSDEARRMIAKKHLAFFDAVSSINFVIEKNGTVSDLCLQQAAGIGLDAEAAQAISQYTFSPATIKGRPVASRSSADVRFATY